MGQEENQKKRLRALSAAPLAVFFLTLPFLNMAGDRFATLSPGYIIAVLIIFFAVELLFEAFKYLITNKGKMADSENERTDGAQSDFEKGIDRISYLASFLAIACSEIDGSTGMLLVTVSIAIIASLSYRIAKRQPQP